MGFRRGDIWEVDFGLAAKLRPAVILSVPYVEGTHALVTCAQCTLSGEGRRWEVPLVIKGKEAHCNLQGIATVAPVKLIRFPRSLTEKELFSVEDALLDWLGFDPIGR